MCAPTTDPRPIRAPGSTVDACAEPDIVLDHDRLGAGPSLMVLQRVLVAIHDQRVLAELAVGADLDGLRRPDATAVVEEGTVADDETGIPLTGEL